MRNPKRVKEGLIEENSGILSCHFELLEKKVLRDILYYF